MDFHYPAGLYTDVRIEHVFETRIRYTERNLEDCKEQRYSAAFIRVYDGAQWYYASTSNLQGIQGEIDALAKLAAPSDSLDESPVYQRLIPHTDTALAFVGRELSSVPLEKKLALLQSAMPIAEQNEYVTLRKYIYIDSYKQQEFYSSKGAALLFDRQRLGFAVSVHMAAGEKLMQTQYSKAGNVFPDLFGFAPELEAEIADCEDFMLRSEPVEPGVYSVIFAPIVTGVFAHECFGHKSESDFMIGDETARREWALGKRVGCEELSILDSGYILGNGYTPYDDEGNRAGLTYLIRNGILTGRLHNADSAADLGEPVTGNGRAMSFEYEPVVRMTTTYIDKGSKRLEDLIAETEDGIFVKSLHHGSGMSTFTIAPQYAFAVKNGKIGKPLRVSVVTGNVFEALSNIDGISDTVEMFSFVTGGCGKMEQFPLPVGFGGPYIRVKNMNVQ